LGLANYLFDILWLLQAAHGNIVFLLAHRPARIGLSELIKLSK
jgi:hypothetical protein